MTKAPALVVTYRTISGI